MKTSKEHIELASQMAAQAAASAKDARTYGSVESSAQRHGVASEAASRAAVANLHVAAMIQSHNESASEPLLLALEAIVAADNEAGHDEADDALSRVAEIAREAIEKWSIE